MNSDSTFTNQKNDDYLDFKRYLSLFISNWYWFAFSIFIAISIAYSINRWSENLYVVSSSILIKDDQLGGMGSGVANIFPGKEPFRTQQNLNNEIGILKSFMINYRVMTKLPDFHVVYTGVGKRGFAETRMYNRCPFIVLYDSLERQTLGKNIEIRIISEQHYELKLQGEKNNITPRAFGDRVTENGFDFIIELRDKSRYRFDPNVSNKYYFHFVSPATLANQYRRRLSITPVEEDASLVTITSTGPVPAQEADYLNMLMEEYRDYGLEYKNLTADQSIGFIEEQLNVISDSLDKAEKELENFRSRHRIIDINLEGTSIQRRIEQINSEMANLQIMRIYYDYLSVYIDDRKETTELIAPSVMGISDQILIRLVDRLSELQQEKGILSMNFNETTRPLRMVEVEIATTKEAIKINIEDGRNNIEKLFAGANDRFKEIEKEISSLPFVERQLINIQRKFEINNTVYTFLLEKRAEAGILKASNVPENRIIDYAGIYSSYRIKPKDRQNLLMALVLGLFFPILGIVVIDYFNNKIIDKKDIERGTSVPAIGFIGHNNLKTEVPVARNPASTLSESFRAVRTNLKYFLRETPNPVIAVSSTITAEGKTFVSTNLAASLASLGKKVLLVGLDLRKPRIHKILGIDNVIGMSSFLIGEANFEDVIIRTTIDNLWYTPSGTVPPNPAELIEDPAMVQFVKKAKENFDYIIIDTPPVAIVTDALLLSPLADFYIFIVRQRYTSKNTLGLLEELKQNKSIKGIGILMNDVSLTGYYGYGLRYGYSMGYGYSYGHNYYSSNYYGRYGYTDGTSKYYNEE